MIWMLNSPVTLERSCSVLAESKLQILIFLPSKFWIREKEKKSTALKAALTVALLLLWSSPEGSVCLPEYVYRVWGRGGNFLWKLETERVTEFSLSRFQSTSRKSCHTIPLSEKKKKKKDEKKKERKKEEQPKKGKLQEEGREESCGVCSVVRVCRSTGERGFPLLLRKQAKRNSRNISPSFSMQFDKKRNNMLHGVRTAVLWLCTFSPTHLNV